jgi:6,7-dimethyl-8-ribityllumazine synthase
MASTIKNLSTFIGSDLPDITSKKFGLVVSEWNDEITHALMSGALETLLKYGAKKENIIIRNVPGSFELTLGAQTLAQDQHIDAVLCLGCVIQGETPHFDFICNAVAQGITSLNLKFHKPVSPFFLIFYANRQKFLQVLFLAISLNTWLHNQKIHFQKLFLSLATL